MAQAVKSKYILGDGYDWDNWYKNVRSMAVSRGLSSHDEVKRRPIFELLRDWEDCRRLILRYDVDGFTSETRQSI
ncbi:hypothetical protein PABG_11099 [Paracoccidioides brasiliensis Pb03]|nr:hypothetical protein PABG_11099 [Paracoccidioides brasiliensis Pb03]